MIAPQYGIIKFFSDSPGFKRPYPSLGRGPMLIKAWILRRGLSWLRDFIPASRTLENNYLILKRRWDREILGVRIRRKKRTFNQPVN